MPQENTISEPIMSDFIDILHRAAIALKNRDSVYLRRISDLSIDTASIIQAETPVSLAVIVYALSKIVDRIETREDPQQTAILERVQNRLEKAEILLQKEKFKDYEEVTKEMIDAFSQKCRECFQELDAILTESHEVYG